MSSIPIKETLMFTLIILGIALFVFSIYLLISFVGGYSFYFPGTIGVTGIFLIFYSLFEDSRNKLAIASFLLIFSIFSTLFNMFFYPWAHELFGFTKPDNGWAYILLPILLISLIITVILYPISRE